MTAERGIARFAVRWLLPVAGTLLAIAALFWLYRDLDFARFVAEVKTANPAWLLVLVVAILAEQLVRSWKWRQILYDLKPISSWRLHECKAPKNA